MANTNAPQGFRVIDAGTASVVGLKLGSVDSSNGTAIFNGDPVMAENDGAMAPASAGIGIALAGVAVGFFNSSGKPLNYLPASTAGTIVYIPALPTIEFEVQTDGSATAAATDVFATADFATGVGSTALGQSRYVLNTTNIGTGNQFRILGKIDTPDNDWGIYVRVRGVFVESLFSSNTSV